MVSLSLPNFVAIQRISKLPIVKSGLDKAANIYVKVKVRRKFVIWKCYFKLYVFIIWDIFSFDRYTWWKINMCILINNTNISIRFLWLYKFYMAFYCERITRNSSSYVLLLFSLPHTPSLSLSPHVSYFVMKIFSSLPAI